jgi:hypothetical protein
MSALKSLKAFTPLMMNLPVPEPVNQILLYFKLRPANVLSVREVLFNLIVEAPGTIVPFAFHTVPVPVSVHVPDPILVRGDPLRTE